MPTRRSKAVSYRDPLPRRGPVNRSRGRSDSSRRTVSFAIFGVGLLVAIGVLMTSLAPQGGSASKAAGASGASYDQKTFEQDVATAQARLAQNPNDVGALIALGNAYYDSKRWADSIPWYSKALEQQPTNTNVGTDLGTAYYYSGDTDKAKAQWEKVIAQEPNKVQTHFNLGILYSNLSPPDADNAAREWETVLKIAPNSEQGKAAEENLKKMGRR